MAAGEMFPSKFAKFRVTTNRMNIEIMKLLVESRSLYTHCPKNELQHQKFTTVTFKQLETFNNEIATKINEFLLKKRSFSIGKRVNF